MGLKLTDLPVELFYDIIAQFEPDDVTPSLLALSRALPRSNVPTYRLFENIRLRRSNQIFKLYQRLRNTPQDATRVRMFSLECWEVDADIFVNLAVLLPSVVRLSLFIGPNFAPEHLEDLFQKPQVNLQELSLRFRP